MPRAAASNFDDAICERCASKKETEQMSIIVDSAVHKPFGAHD